MGFNTVPGYLFPSPLNKTKHRRVKLNQNQEEDLEEEEQKQADGSVQKRIKSNKSVQQGKATRTIFSIAGNSRYLFSGLSFRHLLFAAALLIQAMSSVLAMHRARWTEGTILVCFWLVTF